MLFLCITDAKDDEDGGNKYGFCWKEDGCRGRFV